jgi:hypothetical protein
MGATPTKFIKAKVIIAKVHLPRSKGKGNKGIELIITIPEDVARNLSRRLRTRFPDGK